MATKAMPRKKKQAARAPWWRGWWPLLGIVVLALVAGVAYQGFRTSAPAAAGSGVPAFASAEGAIVKGSAAAPVQIDEYGDFQCPACRRWEVAAGPTVQSMVDSGQVRFAYHPIAILGRESVDAANAALCAGDAGKFWEYHDLLFGNQGAENSGFLTASRLTAWGEQVGAGGGFAACVRDGRYTSWVKGVTEGASKAGINSTPTVLVNGKRLASLDPALLRQAVQSASH